MGLYTGTVRGLWRAPYRTQVEVHLMNLGADIKMTDREAAKIERVRRFMHAADCAREIADERERNRPKQIVKAQDA